jgi:hypothetical protein
MSTSTSSSTDRASGPFPLAAEPHVHVVAEPFSLSLSTMLRVYQQQVPAATPNELAVLRARLCMHGDGDVDGSNSNQVSYAHFTRTLLEAS